MDFSKPKIEDIRLAIDTLTRAAGWQARESVAENPRGATGDLLQKNQAEAARVASMEMSNVISRVLGAKK